MEINVTETEYCKIDVVYEADLEQIEKKRNEVLPYFKNAPVRGFRQGKADIEVIKLFYKNQINESVKRALAEEAFHNTIFEKNIKPFGSPEFKNILLLSNKFTCEFSMHKKPEFELGTWKGLEIPRQKVSFTSSELTQKAMQDMRFRFGESVPFESDAFVETGNNVIIDYKAFNGDEELKNLEANGQLMTIGKSQLTGFDDNLLGMKVGDTREFTLRIPEGGLPSVVGKDVKFVVTLMMGSKVTPLPLTDELAKKAGKENLTELETFLSQKATAQVAEAERNALVNQITSQMLASTEIKIPYWLTLSEAQYLASNAKLEWDPLSDEDKVKFLAVADSNVKLALILDRIREIEPETQLADQEVLEIIKQNLALSHPNPDDALKSMNQNGYLAILAARIKDEFVLDFVLKNSKVIE